MKYSCDMIKDLLTLYCDDVCSEDSKAIVEEHLTECEPCREELNKLKDNTYTDELKEDKNHIVKAYKKGMRKKALKVLLVIFMAPVWICFTINIAVGHTLDWFFIVVTSLGVLASFVLVPLIVEKRRFLWIITSFTATLLLLLLTCCVYSGGDWFGITTIAILFGFSVVFLPFAIRQVPLRGALAQNKGILVMLIDTAMLCLLILFSVSEDLGVSLLTMAYCLVLPWALFLVIRYLKVNCLIKAGICFLITGVYVSTVDCVLQLITSGKISDYHTKFWAADFTDWGMHSGDNVMLIILLSGVALGLILIGFGIVFGKKIGSRNSELTSENHENQ